MELRPRDGNGRAITSKDGLIRSFKKIIDRDQLDPMPEVPVRGGQMYYFKQGFDSQGKQLTKIVPYDAERNKERKVPKFKSNYTKVDDLVKDAAGKTPVEYEKIRTLRKLYVDTLNVISAKQFERMLKEHGVIEKVEEGDNVTDHADLKNFVKEAIDTYKEVHPNRAISLSSQKYKEYIQKVLDRVREQYYIDVSAVVTFDASKSLSEQRTIDYAKGKAGKGTTTGGATDVATEESKVDSVTKMNAANKALKIIGANASDDTTALNGTETLTILNPLTLWSQEREDLVALIKELYKIFIEQTKQRLKEKPELGFQFSDGGGKKKAVGSKGPKGSRGRQGRKGSHAKALAKAKAKAKALAKDGSRRR